MILEAEWTEPVSLTCHFVLRKLNTEPYIVLPTKYQLIWLKGFREDFFNWPFRKKNCLWWHWKVCTGSAISEGNIFLEIDQRTRNKNDGHVC